MVSPVPTNILSEPCGRLKENLSSSRLQIKGILILESGRDYIFELPLRKKQKGRSSFLFRFSLLFNLLQESKVTAVP